MLAHDDALARAHDPHADGHRRERYTPRHRAEHAPASRRLGPVRKAAVLGGVALLATGLAVSSGLLAEDAPLPTAASAKDRPSTVQEMSAADIAEREQTISRSGADREVADPTKAAALSNATGAARTGREDLSNADPKAITRALMPQFGMSPSDFGCVDNIWSQESGWSTHADNPTSSAYGIPQALPGSKMSSAGPNWESNPVTQIKWGLGYLRDRYGSPCAAWSYKSSHGWY